MNPDTIARPLRADAQRNRRRIVDAARELLATRGVDITLDDVAAHAGVGVGTVYRRFTNKQELFEGIFEQRLEDMNERADTVVGDPDPWAALVDFFGYVCESMAIDRGLGDIVLGADDGFDRIAAIRARIDPKIEAIIARAKESRQLRPDVGTGDFFALMTMVSAGAEFCKAVEPSNWRRYFVVVMDGLRAHEGHADALPGRAFTPDEVQCAKTAMHEYRR